MASLLIWLNIKSNKILPFFFTNFVIRFLGIDLQYFYFHFATFNVHLN